MPGLNVRQLGKKLHLLVAYRYYPSLEAVAAKLGRSRITLNGWVNGGTNAEPDTVTTPNIEAFLNLYEDALPKLTPAQVRDVVLGPADDLETLFAAQAAVSLRDLIAEDADTTSGQIYLGDGSVLSLIRTRQDRQHSAKCKIKIGQEFRIEFTGTSRGRFVIALQGAPGGWAVIPCKLDHTTSTLHLPGQDESEAPDLMAEDNEIGRHVFVGIQGNRPFPKEIIAAAKDGGTLDRATLTKLVWNIRDQDRATRRVFAVEVEVTN